MARKPKSRVGIDDVMLIPVSPSQQKKKHRRWALVLITLAALLFGGGFWLGTGGALDSSAANTRLRAQVKTLTRELESARNQLALYRTDNDVTQQAREELRQEIKSLQDQAAELEEAVVFYKSVMAPGAEDGLQIEKATFVQGNENGLYGYRVVLVQAGDNRNYLSGKISLTLKGSKDGKPFTLKGTDWLAKGSETSFKFRYFQELNGQFQLPEGVEVDAVEVDAESGGRNRHQTQKTVKWQ